MTTSMQFVVAIAAATLIATAVTAVLVVAGKGRRDRATARRRAVEHALASHRSGEPLELPVDGPLVLDSLIALLQAAAVGDETVAQARALLAHRRVPDALVRQLRSRRSMDRIEAANYLGYLPSPGVVESMRAAFVREQVATVRYRMAVALLQLDPVGAIPVLGASLPDSSPWYFERVGALLLDGGRATYEIRDRLADSSDPRMPMLLLEFAGRYPAQDLRELLEREVRHEDAWVAEAAARSLAALYPRKLATDEFLRHAKPKVRDTAVACLARSPGEDPLEILLGVLREDARSEGRPAGLTGTAVGMAIADLLRREPGLTPTVADAFSAESDPAVRLALAEPLAMRIQYFLVQLVGSQRERVREVVREVLVLGRTAETITFVNRNSNIELENEILQCMREATARRPDLEVDLRHYLRSSSLAKLGLEPLEFGREKRQEARERPKLVYLYVLLAIAVLAFPSYFVIQYWDELGSAAPVDLARSYVVDWNVIFIFYTGALQFMTMALLVFALFGARAQAQRWRTKPASLLSRPRALPSVSIIAPAYNEQSTIIESVNSLLGLQYPDFELVVVNDGSSDGTLDVLMSYFELEKVDRSIDHRLRTRLLHGIYVNPSIPQLVVIDKDNGGKADSLNAGINVASKEYFCGIDADSLLEADAMLKVAAGCLDSEIEMVASGGNIFPINGCTVERGSLTEIRLPPSSIARFQTIEYIRAFMAGRVGWARLDALLIISGAFGLFRRERVIQVGGYLTESGRYGKDTVGEDMELVVRLRRDMTEAGVPHTIDYAFNANCWTEVPESLSVLHRQRDRWQRGLVDIQFFHRRLLMNPRYGTTGLLGMPYYFLFEMFGPLIEVQGYLMVVLALVLGVLNPTIAIALFVTVILWGVLVSMLSLYMAEGETSYFSRREVLTLVWYAVIENFGFRQLLSFWRVSGYISAMRRPKGWGAMSRKGFAAAPAPAA